MAVLSIAGGENSKPVNNDGSEHRHPDNVSPITPLPVDKPPLARTPEKDDDNGKDKNNDKMEKDVYKPRVAKTPGSFTKLPIAKPLGGQTTGKIQGDR